MRRYILYLLLSTGILASSCTPLKRAQWHVRRAAAIYPPIVKTDTIRKIDTVYSPLVTTDTIFKYFQKDTVIVREGKLTMKYFYNNHDSTVYLNGRCDPDTLIREIVIGTSSINVEDKPLKWWQWVLMSLGGVAIVLVILDQIAARLRPK
jgi:hypothetical protein